MGDSTAERIRNSGIRSFYKWLAESPHTIRDLSVERGINFDAIILTNKDKEAKKILQLNVSNDTLLLVGDIINWQLEDGSLEKWIIIQEEKKVNGTYRTFLIVRCNYLLKWVDNNGHVQQSWSYFVSSLDSKIKGNFRTWNSLISPQPNKYAEVLMPRYPIDRATNFIVQQQSWTVVEYDHTSVPGVIYLSLTEGKINSIYDDVENDLADTDKIVNYQLSIPSDIQYFHIDDDVKPVFTLTKNGVPSDEPVILNSSNKSVVKLIDGKLKAIGAGEALITVTLQNYPTIFKTINVEISAQEQQFQAYIEGPATIRLDRQAIYTLRGTSEIVGQVLFTIEEPTKAIINKASNEYKKETFNSNISCVVLANSKNILQPFILKAEYNNKIYTKEISIIPLW